VAFSKPNATVATAATENPDACWELLKYINGEETNKCEAMEGLWPPNLQRVLTSDWFLTRDTAPYNMAPTVPGLLCDGQAPQLSPFAAQCRVIFQQELDPVWTGDATMEEVAPIIEAACNELLESGEPAELS
jgi:ABC-type glycerol-3-phosphate transport system substrate-binding protein